MKQVGKKNILPKKQSTIVFGFIKLTIVRPVQPPFARSYAFECSRRNGLLFDVTARDSRALAPCSVPYVDSHPNQHTEKKKKIGASKDDGRRMFGGWGTRGDLVGQTERRLHVSGIHGF